MTMGETQFKDFDVTDDQEIELIDRKKRTIAGKAGVAKRKFGTLVVADVKEKAASLEIRLDADFPDVWFQAGNYIRIPE